MKIFCVWKKNEMSRSRQRVPFLVKILSLFFCGWICNFLANRPVDPRRMRYSGKVVNTIWCLLKNITGKLVSNPLPTITHHHPLLHGPYSFASLDFRMEVEERTWTSSQSVTGIMGPCLCFFLQTQLAYTTCCLKKSRAVTLKHSCEEDHVIWEFCH